MTLGINQLTWRGLLRRSVQGVLDQVEDDHLPGGFLDDPATLVDELARRLAALADDLRALDAGAAVDAEVRRFLTTRGSRLPGGLRDVLAVRDLDDQTLLRRRPGHPCSLVGRDDRVEVLLGDRSLDVPGVAAAGVGRAHGQAGAPTGGSRRIPRRPEPAGALSAARPGRTARGPGVTAGPAPGDPDFRCAAASLLRDERVAGTASTVRAFLLLEQPGSWGTDALRDARLPDGLGGELRRRAAQAGVRVLLVRRPGRARRGAAGPAGVACSRPSPTRSDLAWSRRRCTDLRSVLDLDLAALRAAGSVGLDEHDDSLFCVCTHGRHDACCAERGRPVAAALARAHPEETWEVSHIGGDRFAGNALVLPHGLYYGRLEPPSALALAGAHLSGHLDLDRLRGRSGHPMPVQFAEIELRRQLGETGLQSLRLVSRRTDGNLTEAVFDLAGTAYAVRVRSAPGTDLHRLTCRATRDNPIAVHALLGISRR